MKNLLPIGTLLTAILFFFIGTSTLKLKDKNWADTGTVFTSYALSVVLLIGAIFLFNNKN